MNIFVKYLTCFGICYLICTLNPTYIISKIKGINIRKSGSGNVGASNAVINFGAKVGVLCALFDIAKAALSVLAMTLAFKNAPLTFSVASVGAVTGHMFPFYMGFKGGKGLACLGGVILCFNPLVFLIVLACEIAIVLLTDYICFVPLTASLAFPVIYGIMRNDLLGALILGIITAVIFLKHIQNLRRIKNGREMHFSYLWSKDKEKEKERVSRPD